MEKKIPSRIRRKRNIKIKKSTVGLFVGFFAFVASMFYVFAGENNKLIVGVTKDASTEQEIQYATKGQEIAVTIDLECEKEYNSGYFKVNFDPSVLEYTGAWVTEYFNPSAGKKDKLGLSAVFPTEEADVNKANTNGEVEFGLLTLDATKAACESIEDYAEVYFTVKNDAPGGVSSITISDQTMGKQIGNQAAETLTVDHQDGYVMISVPVDPDSVALEQSTYEIQKGSNATLTVVYEPEDTSDEMNASYVSSNPEVVSVDSNGVMTANATGSATISVTAFGQDLTATVSVTNHITAVTITGTKSDIAKEEELQLTGAVTPDDTSDDKTLIWSSSNPEVADVDQDGLVTGISGGETTITAKSQANETILDTYVINVVVPMTSFTSSDSTGTVNLNKGDTKTISTTIEPGDTTESKTISWVSSDTDVAVVDQNGLVTAVGGGLATITGTLPNERAVTITVSVSVPIDKVELDNDYIELVPEQYQTLHATITPNDQTEAEGVEWATSNGDVATVDASGKVTAVNPGTATITATAGSKSDTAVVKVLIPIESVAISEPSITLNRNEKATLTLNITPSTAEEDKTVMWSSTDPQSVSVDQNGVITGLKGTQSPVTITASLNNGKHDSSQVTVIVKIESIDINKTETTINKGESETLTISINPSDTSEDPTVTWTSSNPSVAEVDSNGKVTAVAAGNAVITATVGTFQKTCAVTVEVPMTSVEINSEDLTLNRGDTTTLTATVKPTDTTESYTITWASSKTNVATIDNNGLLTAVGAGDTTITVSAGSKTDTIKVTVKVPITGFTATTQSIELVKGESETIGTTITPTDTTEITDIEWTTSNANIATVDENGKVTGKSAGTATITGTLENGMHVDVTVVVTIIPVESISVSKPTLDLKRKETATLTVTWTPENATEYEDVEWTSSDDDVATVDANGKVTAVAEGTATITARMGSLTDTSVVTVTEVPLEDIALDENPETATVGKKFKLAVTLKPSDATDDITYEYESSDESIATVDSEGNVTSKKAGTVTFTVKATANGVTHTQTVTLTFNAPTSPDTGVTPIWIYAIIVVALISTALLICKKKELF